MDFAGLASEDGGDAGRIAGGGRVGRNNDINWLLCGDKTRVECEACGGGKARQRYTGVRNDISRNKQINIHAIAACDVSCDDRSRIVAALWRTEADCRPNSCISSERMRLKLARRSAVRNSSTSIHHHVWRIGAGIPAEALQPAGNPRSLRRNDFRRVLHKVARRPGYEIQAAGRNGCLQEVPRTVLDISVWVGVGRGDVVRHRDARVVERAFILLRDCETQSCHVAAVGAPGIVLVADYDLDFVSRGQISYRHLEVETVSRVVCRIVFKRYDLSNQNFPLRPDGHLHSRIGRGGIIGLLRGVMREDVGRIPSRLRRREAHDVRRIGFGPAFGIGGMEQQLVWQDFFAGLYGCGSCIHANPRRGAPADAGIGTARPRRRVKGLAVGHAFARGVEK